MSAQMLYIVASIKINGIYCTMHSVTYNPWLCGVGKRTTRSPLTTSERSTAIGITTGMIGTTDDREGILIMSSIHIF